MYTLEWGVLTKIATKKEGVIASTQMNSLNHTLLPSFIGYIPFPYLSVPEGEVVHADFWKWSHFIYIMDF